MPDHLFLTVGDLRATNPFYEHALAPMGLHHVPDQATDNGPPGMRLRGQYC